MFYRDRFGNGSVFPEEARLSALCGELTLYAPRFPGGTTAEVGWRPPHGTRPWVIGRPPILPN